MNNTINEINNNLESLRNRIDLMEERISLLEDKNVEILQVEEEAELRFLKNKGILQKIYDSIRKSNIWIIGIQEGEEREKAGGDFRFRDT